MIAFILLEWIWFVAALGLLGVATAHSATGLSVMFGLAFATLWFWVNPAPISDVLIYAILYLIIGSIWSIWRYRRYVQIRMSQVSFTSFDEKRYTEKDFMDKYSVRELSPERSMERIVHWILIWPFSMIENLTTDIIQVVRVFVTRGLANMYNYIYASVVQDSYKNRVKEENKGNLDE